MEWINKMTSIARFEGQFIKQEKEIKKSKPKRDTAGVVQGSMHKSPRHAGAYGDI